MKKVLKRSLSLLLAITIIFGSMYVGLSEVDFDGLCVVKAKAASSGTCGGELTWFLNSSGTLTIRGTGDMYSYYSYSSIPWYSSRASIKTVTIESGVTGICARAFDSCENLTSVNISDTVTSIGEYAFNYCKSLTSIEIPHKVKSINNRTFYNCTSLTSVDIPYGVTEIGEWAFAYCFSLKSISIPDSVISIGNDAFTGCKNLTSITLPNKLQTIGSWAFSECIGLTSITIPDSVTRLGDRAFSTCTNLTSVTLSKGMTEIERGTFAYCSKLVSVTIPESITSIGETAFNNCTSLTSITIPASVTSIGPALFMGCNNLAELNIAEGNTSFSVDNGVLFNKDKTELIEYLDSKTDTEYIIPNSVKFITKRAFYNCKKLTSITIPNGVTDIGMQAFAYCGALVSIVLPDTVKNIGDGAFGLTGVSEFVIPEGISAVGCEMFYGCSNLTSITIPGSVTSIGDDAFSECTSLTSIEIPDSVTSIGNNAFSDSGYYNNSSNWENDVLYIENFLIKAKTTLAGTYTIKDGTTVIADNAFYYCKNLTAVAISDSVTSIGRCAFFSCTSLNSVIIGDTVTSIDELAFGDCESLTTVTIPASVKSIGEDALECRGLKYVFYLGTEQQWNEILIESNDYLERLPIHFNTTEHTYSTEWTIDQKPTCTSEGSKSYHCTVCNYKSEITSIAALGHSYSTEWTIDIEPTCTTEGSQSRHCNTCGAKTDITKIDTLEHSYSTEWTIDIEPTCTTEGSQSRHCNTCGAKTDVTAIAALGHSYSTEWTVDIEPTCTTEGSKSHHCVVCDDKNDVVSINASGHFFDGYDSWGNNQCIYCKKYPDYALNVVVKTEVLESAHNYENNKTEKKRFSAPGADYIEITFSSLTEVENSCDKIYIADNDGIHIATYTGTELANKTIRIEDDYVQIELYADGSVNKYGFYATCKAYKKEACNNHLHKMVINQKVAFCTMTGYTGDIICAVCETIIEQGEVIPAPGHSCDEWIIDLEPSCTEAGSKHGDCSGCGMKNAKAVIPALGHSYGDWVIDVVATCTEAGSRHRACSVCGEVETEELSATGHLDTMWVIEKEPTCTKNGYKEEYCLDCVDIINTEEIPALGHSYGDWVIDVAATCTEDGLKHQICSVCNDVKTEVILSTGHSYSTEWTIDVAPTCTEEGSKSHHCIACDNAKEDITVVASLGHNFRAVSVANEHPHIVLSECTRCPETKQEESYSEKCGVCNFTYEDIDENTCKITGYIGNSITMTIPSTINGKTVAATSNGVFKGNTTLISVKIENGVQSIGTLAFLGCSSLSKVVIPESVTSIGTKAFYNCASDFTLYCYSGSYAEQYAIDNSLNYVVMDIGETDNSTIDYENEIIFVSIDGLTSLDDIIYIPTTSTITAQASLICGNNNYFGTGSIVTVIANGVTSEYTLVVEGDTNGDSVCDALDAMHVGLASNGHRTLDGAYALAADSNADDVVDANDYQAIVNKAVS